MSIGTAPIASAPIAGSAEAESGAVITGTLDATLPMLGASFTAAITTYETVTESFVLAETTITTPVMFLADAIQATATETHVQVSFLASRLVAALSLGVTRDVVALVVEELISSAALTRGMKYSLSDLLEVVETPALTRLLTLLDSVELVDTKAAKSAVLLAAAFTVAATLARQARAVIQEELVGVDTQTNSLKFTLVDLTTLQDDPNYTKELLLALLDSVTVVATQTALRERIAVLQDSFLFGGLLDLPDGQYEAWVLNLENFAASQYVGWDFNSFSGDYAARADGIYYLEGGSDAGTQIDAWVLTDLLDFQQELSPEDANKANNLKRNPIAYLAGTTDGRLMLKTRAANQTGQFVEDWFEVVGERVDPVNQRFFLGRRNLARFYQYQLENVNGADFDINNFSALVILQERKW